MLVFDQLLGEPADAFAQLLVHRDAGTARLYRETAIVTGASESTLRRRAERWNWQTRLDAYDTAMLKKMELESTEQALRRQADQLRDFRDLQLERARKLGDLADLIIEFIHHSLVQHQESGLIVNLRELSPVLSSSSKVMELSMNTEATALGVTELLERYLDLDK